MSEGVHLELVEHCEKLPLHDGDNQVGSSEISVTMNGDSEQNVKPETKSAQVPLHEISVYSFSGISPCF